MSEKISKAAATYAFHPDVEYTCLSCLMLKPLPNAKSGCAWFGPSETVNAKTGSCNYYAHGDPSKTFDVPWFSLFTKPELGYDENSQGFSCKRCSEFKFPKEDCEKVDKSSDGDTPGIISPNGCCSLWEADPKRSKMTTPALLQLMAGPKAHAIVRMQKGG